MSYQVFARKYRPRTFDDVIGQDHVVRTLRNAIEQERLAHAYLFVGPRGTGKTSTARIFAKALNCTDGPKVDFDPDEDICIEISEGRSLDVLEIDGASNNGVDQVRELRESANFAPARGLFKIYYIDEVHMLSPAAFNALLKILEEPPAHVKFIFATTEPQKILATILSRCQRFDLRPIPTQAIAEHLLKMATLENIDLDETAAWAIARGADGGMRDAQSMLDQLVAFCGHKIAEADVLDVFGFTSRETVASLLVSLLGRDTPATLSILQREAESGRELGQLLAELVDTLRALLVAKIDPGADGEGIPEDSWLALKEVADKCPTDRILAIIDVFAETEGRMRWATHKRLHFEIGLMKAVQVLGEARISDVIKVVARAADSLPDPAVAIPATEPASPPPEKPPQPAPEPPAATQAEPAPAPPPAEPTPAPAPKRTNPANGTSRLDSFIEQAPEHVEPEPQPEPEPPAAPLDLGPDLGPGDTPPEISSCQDPLIQKALDIFKGKIT